MNSIDVIVMTAGGGFRARTLLADTLRSFRQMVTFSGALRILVHDDPIYLKPTQLKGKLFRDNLASRARCLEFRQWLQDNSASLGIDEIIFSAEWQHIGGSIQRLISCVQSPVYFHLEDDFLFLKEINLDPLLRRFESPAVNAIRFSRLRNEVNWWNTILRPCNTDGVDLLAVSSWAFDPSLVRTAKMKEFIELGYVRRFQASENNLMEAYRQDIKGEGFEASHRRWGSYIYGTLGDSPAVQHIGKRAIEECPAARARPGAKGAVGALLLLLPRSDLRVLDVGSGDLAWSLPEYKIVRADRNPRKLPSSLRMDPRRALPFVDSSFDAIVAMNLSENVDSVREFIQECGRIVKEYGLIIVGIESDFGLKCELETACRQGGLSIVSQVYMANGEILVKALRDKSRSDCRRVNRSLTKGWVVTSDPLGDGEVKLEFHRYLEVGVKLKGAPALTQYTIGLNLYGADVPFFGIATRCAYNPGTAIGDGIAKKRVNSFVICAMRTDVKGKGHVATGFPVKPGTYDVQVWLSKDQGGAAASAVCYKSGATFGDSDLITIEPTREVPYRHDG
jgi:SAM-dependent methyltransferase